METTSKCPLCGRDMAEPTNKHHLVPLSKGERDTPTVVMHKICHDKIHSMFSETELKRYYHTVERLQEHEDIVKFIKWLRNKPPEFYDRPAKMKK